jgi:hypothetical protein
MPYEEEGDAVNDGRNKSRVCLHTMPYETALLDKRMRIRRKTEGQREYLKTYFKGSINKGGDVDEWPLNRE